MEYQNNEEIEFHLSRHNIEIVCRELHYMYFLHHVILDLEHFLKKHIRVCGTPKYPLFDRINFRVLYHPENLVVFRLERMVGMGSLHKECHALEFWLHL